MQLFVSPEIEMFENILRKKYNFDNGLNINKPTLFWGIYGFSDLNILRSHIGQRIVVFNGTDATHKKILRLLRTFPETQNVTCIAGSDWVEDDLKEASIEHTKIKLLMSDLKIWQ